MKLALGLDLYRGATLEVPVEQVRRAEALGYHSVWTAEAYGSDALSPLAYLAAVTTRIKLGTGVVQIAARTPAATAMHALTIDALAGGNRVIIGLGVSGPQIVEGWYGQPWGSPNQRLREYVAIMRKVFAREPLTNDGPEFPLPYNGPGAVGQGKPLRSILHPAGEVEIWLAAGGPKNTELRRRGVRRHAPDGLGRRGRAASTTPSLDSGLRAPRRPARRLRDLRRRHRRVHRRRARPRSRPRSPSPPCTSAAWGRRRTTTTAPPWPGAATRRRRPASRSCGSPDARRRRWPPCPTSTSRRARCSAPRSASANGGSSVVPSGLTGLIVRTDDIEGSSWSPTSPASVTPRRGIVNELRDDPRRPPLRGRRPASP